MSKRARNSACQEVLDYCQLMEAAALYVKQKAPKVDSPEAVATVMRPLLQNLDQESLWVITLNVKHHVIGIHEVTKGLADRSQAHPREIFRHAIRDNASRIILVHNHPSGDPTPSTQDTQATHQLTKAGAIVGIDLLDHIVMAAPIEGQSDHVSMRECGLLKEASK